MIMKNRKLSLVSIVIPTKNSAKYLADCLASIKNQTYPNIEVIIVDSNSADGTLSIAKKYNTRLYKYTPKVMKGIFDAAYKRNYGVKKAAGEYVYYVDADMVLTKEVVAEAVNLCQKGYQAAIISEDSFGTGIWARAKNLERRCYWGDDRVEAPRFFKKKIWQELGGLDESVGGGGDDWDLYQKLLDSGYKAVRTQSKVLHNEGNLRLFALLKKRFMYGRESIKYIIKRPKAAAISYFPIRRGYLKNWKIFLTHPIDTFFFLIMRILEYLAGLSGVIYSLVK